MYQTTSAFVLAFAIHQHDEMYRTMRDTALLLNQAGVRLQDRGGWIPVEPVHVAAILQLASCGYTPERVGTEPAYAFSTVWERNGAVIAERRAHPGSGGCGGRCGS